MGPSVRRPSSVPSQTSPSLPTPPTSEFRWYAVKVHSGREETVRDAIERRVRIEALEPFVGRVLVPVEKVIELRRGRRVERTRKLFSGYVLCEIALDDAVLAVFREIPGVSDFVRSGGAPVPLS